MDYNEINEMIENAINSLRQELMQEIHDLQNDYGGVEYTTPLEDLNETY